MPKTTNLSVELRGEEEAVAAIRQVDPTLPPGEITERLNVAVGLLEYRTRAGLAEPSEWKPLSIKVTEVSDGDA
ncbi:hypothetical protein LCGC14_1243640 [marine sediment metagenome]|uniref:Uncharacterized protein n=1 Tax=marine sediment metagenome TaxID=412755 RepID=A0A0F9NMD0_9ZZZZ